MKQADKERLIDQFWMGETSIQEEVLLKRELQNDGVSEIELAYLNYVDASRHVPDELEKLVWNSVKKNRENLRIRIHKIALVASILLLIGVVGYLKIRKEHVQKMETQFALLEKTLGYVSKELAPPQHEILYQDDFIVIVAN